MPWLQHIGQHFFSLFNHQIPALVALLFFSSKEAWQDIPERSNVFFLSWDPLQLMKMYFESPVQFQYISMCNSELSFRYLLDWLQNTGQKITKNRLLTSSWFCTVMHSFLREPSKRWRGPNFFNCTFNNILSNLNLINLKIPASFLLLVYPTVCITRQRELSATVVESYPEEKNFERVDPLEHKLKRPRDIYHEFPFNHRLRMLKRLSTDKFWAWDY